MNGVDAPQPQLTTIGARLSSSKPGTDERRGAYLTNGDLTMYQKILLAYDGSPDGREALAQVRNLACMSGAAVRLLAIIDPSENMLAVEGMSFVPDNQRVVVQSVLDAGVRRLQSVGCAATNDVRYGNPAEQIVLSAREMNADN
jgi:nucleotide-binding universal stress UspA family protein